MTKSCLSHSMWMKILRISKSSVHTCGKLLRKSKLRLKGLAVTCSPSIACARSRTFLLSPKYRGLFCSMAKAWCKRRTPERRKLTGTLAKEIETLLAGKSLETPELKALTRIDADESRPTVLAAEPAAFKKIEELGGVVIRGEGLGAEAEIGVNLEGIELGDELLAKLVPHLKQVEKISCLTLQNTRVTDAGLEPLRGMSNIDAIDLEGTAISDRGLDALKTISSLKYVLLAGTRVTEGGTLALKRRRPGLLLYYLTPAKSTK